MKKMKLSDIQNFLFIIIVGLCILLLNMKSISELSRLIITAIIVMAYIASFVIECINNIVL